MVNARLPEETDFEQKVTEIIDLGYDATLVSTALEDGVLVEVQVGPFESNQQAESAVTILRRSMRLDPYVVVIQRETQANPDPPESDPQ